MVVTGTPGIQQPDVSSSFSLSPRLLCCFLFANMVCRFVVLILQKHSTCSAIFLLKHGVVQSCVELHENHILFYLSYRSIVRGAILFCYSMALFRVVYLRVAWEYFDSLGSILFLFPFSSLFPQRFFTLRGYVERPTRPIHRFTGFILTKKLSFPVIWKVWSVTARISCTIVSANFCRILAICLLVEARDNFLQILHGLAAGCFHH